MSKWIKWIVLILIAFQIINYFYVKQKTPQKVLSLIERNGCEGYEVFRMNLPFNYVFKTETDTTVYLTNPTKQNVDLSVKLIDPTVPLFKGWGGHRYKFTSEEVTENFSHCWKNSDG